MKLSKVLKEALESEIRKGHIALAPFPYSDRDESKVRPCLVLAKKGDDILCAYMSSKLERDGVLIKSVDLSWSELKEPNALVRPDKLATIDVKRIEKIVGHLVEPKRKEIVSRINTLIQ